MIESHKGNTQPKLVDLPSPTDGESLERMEGQITEAIEHLAENARLRSIISSPPWGWYTAEIMEMNSAKEARILVMTKIRRILSQRSQRIGEARFRIRFTDPDTEWDQYFGLPTSVLRVDVGPQGLKNLLEEPAWLPGVTVGKLSSNQYLVWQWGE